MNSLVIINPAKRKTRKGGKIKMLKKRKTKRRRTVAANPRKKRRVSRARRARRYPRTAKSRIKIMTRLEKALPVAAGVAGGLVGSKLIVNFAMPSASGYLRGALQIGAGLGLAIVWDQLLKRPDVSTGLLAGGVAAGLLTGIDEATAGQYSLAGPRRGLSDYVDLSTGYRSMSDYVDIGDFRDPGYAGTAPAESFALRRGSLRGVTMGERVTMPAGYVPATAKYSTYGVA